MTFVDVKDATLGEIYLVNHPRFGRSGFDLFVPTPALGAVMDKLVAAAKGGGPGVRLAGLGNGAHRSGHSAFRRRHG